jgi:hypothetical protein
MAPLPGNSVPFAPVAIGRETGVETHADTIADTIITITITETSTPFFMSTTLNR